MKTFGYMRGFYLQVADCQLFETLNFFQSQRDHFGSRLFGPSVFAPHFRNQPL